MKKYFEAHEKDCQEALGLDPTVTSGSQWHDLGDGVSRNAYEAWPIIFDSKCTVQKSYSMNREYLAQWMTRAIGAGKRFAMPIRFINTDKGRDITTDYVIIPLDDYTELITDYRERRDKE